MFERIRATTMAFRASMRRDQRRRLLASRQRDSAGADGLAPDGADHVAATAYDDEAHPERHPALATRLPVGAGRFFAIASAIVLVFGGAIALAVSGPLFGRPLVGTGGRFARTLAVVAAAFDSRAGMPVQVWLAELALLVAAAIAGAIRLMRRHRRDDYKGRFRAWGWLAWMLAAAAWAGAVPVGALVAALLSDATGIVPGPNGVGWWAGLAAVAFAVVVPWAVLPLRERGATLAWMVVALAFWGVAAALPWATVAAWFGGEARGAIVAQAAWVAGAGLMLVAMLAAARSVIREVRGQCAAVPARRAKPKRAAAVAAADEAEGHDDAEGSQAAGDWSDGSRGEDDDEDSIASDDHGDTDFVDGSDAGGRRLSKSERKRLKKLARMNGHAA
jgi:hypothetical protein